MRAPWQAPSKNREFSWTTFWWNVGCAAVISRFLVGAGVTIGGLSWQPGEMDAAMPLAILSALGGLYGWRRAQDAAAQGSSGQGSGEEKKA